MMNSAPAPLFRDPIYDGAADPTLIWNRQEGAWWLLYTCRRANVACPRFAWVHGTDIGVASTVDGGQRWLYRGVLDGLEFEKGRNTFWAPEILWCDGLYHMYVSYVPGVPVDWSGTRHIVHMTSPDLWQWRFESRLALSSERVIDACVYRLPDGRWRMWYKDEVNGAHTYAAESDDLYRWRVCGPVITDGPHEGPNVFYWRGWYWLIADTWKGLGVYRSADAERWERQADILDRPGSRADDRTVGLHADVLVQGERAYVFYFTHPDRATPDEPDEPHPLWYKRTSIQVAELEIHGGALVCDRDRPFDFKLEESPSPPH
jgi:hypothetical protein